MPSPPTTITGTRRVALAIAATHLTACHFDGTAYDPLLVRANEWIDAQNEASAISCECSATQALTNASACAAAEAIDPERRRCMLEALARDADGSVAYLECVLPLERDLTECLDTNLRCEAPDSARACRDVYEIGLAACSEPPATVDRALPECGP